MSAPTKQFERVVLDESMNHQPDPVLIDVDNVALAFDPAGNMKVTKQKSGGKVDGVVAPLWRWVNHDVRRRRHTPGIARKHFNSRVVNDRDNLKLARKIYTRRVLRSTKQG